ncbi:MAG: hypothetical protein M1833_004683 [Piccolia ochrophora]|nr:MAG: hypothetical protein M1833_004683 [Piccolia ochrophora]
MSMLPAPGRPGNLTAEQEEKLREFWLALLKVFGVPTESSQHGGDNEHVDSTVVNGEVRAPEEMGLQSRTDTAGSEKKKKKSKTFFSRKSKKSQSTEPAPTTSTKSSASQPVSSSSDGDDKYGQTKAFKAALASQSPEDLRAAFWSMVKHDHPDSLLLRFLRARKWDVEKALVMLVSTMHWRYSEMHVDDDVIKVGEAGAVDAAKSSTEPAKKEGEEFLTQLRLGKSFLHGVDKEGRPICVVRVRLHKQGEQSEKTMERYTVYIIETARLFLKAPVDTAAVLFDMTGFSLANMVGSSLQKNSEHQTQAYDAQDYAPVKFMIKCFEANYPESLGVVLVHKAPWVFQGIWNIIKGWLDPVVASKIHFTKTIEELEHFIPKNHILKDLGGEEDWSYQFIEPQANENHQMSDNEAREALLTERESRVEDFEKATISWIESGDSSGSKSKRDGLASSLAENYWKLDPYTRARTLYDRTGVLKPGGYLDFYPQSDGVQSGDRIPVPEPHANDVD